MEHQSDVTNQRGVGTCLYILGGIGIICVVVLFAWIAGMIYFLFFSRYYVVGICMGVISLLVIWNIVRRRLIISDGFDPSL